MAYKFSRKAEEDLEVLTAHGIEQFGFAQAKRYYLGLIEALEFLSTYPQAAKGRPELGRTTRGDLPPSAPSITMRALGVDS